MIPSLAAAELREAIVEYLSTTYAIGDEETRDSLIGFLTDEDGGIFRGPFLRVRTPFQRIEDAWMQRAPLDWMPTGFRPFVHQAQAFERLATRDVDPRPTLVTTGTGSGKTECFLIPILDHCVRAVDAGQAGIKALILYPMNALATDQAGRIARMIHDDPRLAGIRAGIFIGGESSGTAVMTPSRIIDDQQTLRSSPPDILLTNYKMLDFLLLRDTDRELWAGTGPGVLRHLVLDEFHTYDGAQGTDVAMLLRRLGVTLNLADGTGRPLGAVAPVATSATLGDGTGGTDALREFAESVFGCEFEHDSVIGERRESVNDCCKPVDWELPVPEIVDLQELDGTDPNALAAAFTGRELADAVDLGEVLLAHRMTRAILAAVGARPTPAADALEEIALRVAEWGPHLDRDRGGVEHAVALYLGLLSIARRPGSAGGPPAPLFSVEVQLWIREVSRVTRLVQPQPAFRWLDGAALEPEELPEEEPPPTAPAIYCRLCGRTGWMARSSEMNGALSFVETGIYEESVRSSPRLRALIHASAAEPGVQYLDPELVALHHEHRSGCLPVLVTAGDDEARRSECPSCGGTEGIRFLGSRVASLASVSISQLFGSDLVGDGERKLLAFTDSVQDAAHRAAFFNGRTHRFNQRIAMTSIVRGSRGGRLSLADLGQELMREAETSPSPAQEFYELVPPDLLRHFGVRTLWNGDPRSPGARQLLGRRVDFETQLEFGLRARLGRTIELTGALAAEVPLDDINHLAALVIETRDDLIAQIELIPEAESFEDPDVYLRGLLERTRLQGAIFHPWLNSYLKDEGRRYLIWGGRPDGLPAFPSGQSAPTFLVDAQGTPFDALESRGGSPVWTADWASRTLRVPLGHAREFTRRVLTLLAQEEIVSNQKSAKGNTIYGLKGSAIAVHDIADGDSPVLRCRVCAHRHAAPAHSVGAWDNAPCLRYRCPGRYEPVGREASAYYRRLYRSGTPRRTVAAEHTGGLDRPAREKLENAFKNGHGPGTPNVLACTPTLEMGVDIGDLSAVMLTSVPRSSAAYVQRVGRAGRASGNALVTTFVRTEPRSLYFLADPRHMIAGAVRPPSCWLDAIEILRRQYFAFVLDRAADGSIAVAALPHRIGALVKDAGDESGVLRTILAKHDADPASYLNGFLAGFGDRVSPATAGRLRAFAEHELGDRVRGRLGDWDAEYKDLQKRRDRLTSRIKELEARSTRTEDEEFELKSLGGERKATVARFQRMREEYTPAALERLGVLPNYTLVDAGVTLKAALWAPTADGDYSTENLEYKRPAALAIRELAPGARFYAGGHRVIVDALDLGPASDPGYERWRLCPECGFGTADQGALASCPRCFSTAIADEQSRHLVLPFTGCSAQSSEDNARISDDTEDRERTPFTVITTVDVDPDDVRPERAWRARNEDQPFGFEYASATLRWLNFGQRDKPGDTVTVGGRDDIRASRFDTCRYCGVVQTVPETYGRTPPAEGFHRGWCLTRSGARNAAPASLILAHELRTDVVRIALPLADFEVAERLASFRAALLFGLQLHFGGTPDHLRAVVGDAPGGSDGGRRRFLVIHDIVPGGTGYLERLADPVALKGILEVARSEIARCPCKDEGRAACHRCLLGHADHADAAIVARRLVLELLDELLRDWDLVPVPTIGNLPIGAVEESELERRLRVALIAWGERTDGASVTKQPGAGRHPELELRVPSAADPKQLLRWRIREQHDLDTSPPTRPDFLIERVDGNARAVALYSDGFQYHASPAKRATLADDARKRHGVRASGCLAWSMDWNDVESFRTAVIADVAKQPPNLELLDAGRRKTTETIQHVRGGKLPVDTLERNPLRMLLNYLADPVEADWQRLARSAVAGSMSGLVPEQGAGVASFEGSTMSGVRFDAALDTSSAEGANAERWTVRLVLPDDEDAVLDTDHRDRWRDWLHWGNVLQFLDGDGCQALITTTSIEDDLEVDLAPVGGPSATEVDDAPADQVLPEEIEAEIGLADASVQSLLRAVARVPRARTFVVGHETTDGALLEAAWPDARVAVLIDGQVAPNDWTARHAAAWDASALIDAVTEGGELMAQIALAKTFMDDLVKLDRGLQRKVQEMIGRLQRDHSSKGLNLERYNAAEDPRSRSARVDIHTRAILATAGSDTYILVKVLPHDQADRWMENNRFNVNQLTGALEVMDVTTVQGIPAAAAPLPEEPAGPLDGVPDKAFAQLGITDQRVIAVARRMTTPEEVELLASALPDDQAEALTGLAIGMSVDEIYASMVARLDTPEEPVVPDLEDLAAAVKRPASRSAFMVLENEDALVDVLTRDFEAWHVFLHPSQRAVVERQYNGPARVTGGAGTGKTVALLHRARRLAQAAGSGGQRVLVTTFTTNLQETLVESLRALGGPELLARVHVSTVDALARRTVADAEDSANVGVLVGPRIDGLWQDVIDEEGFLFSKDFLSQEWEQVILARNVKTRDEYFATVRAGRGVRLPRRERANVWRAVEAFETKLQRSGKRTFLQLAGAAAGYLDGAVVKPYDHILVDEAQDLHPAQWRLLRAAVAPGRDDLFIAGDAHQRIYDNRVSLNALDIETRGRSRRLRVNYRTTHEILRWSLELLAGQTFDDLDDGEDSLDGYRSVTRGRDPAVAGRATRREELDALADQIRTWQADGINVDEVGICARTRQTAEVAEQHLRRARLLPTEPGGAIRGPYIGTMHGMKGLEFRAVAMLDVGETSVPPSAAVTDASQDPVRHAQDLQRERCLLYVAATRAREALAVSWTGKPSRLLAPDGCDG